jgi:cell division protein FtsI/penicillin-binding protein 2
MDANAKETAFKLWIVRGVVVLIAIFILLKLFSVQVIHREAYSEKADRQYIAPVGDVFERGSIYFSRKDGTLVSAATLTSGFKVAIEPKSLTDTQKAYEAISAVTPLDKVTFDERAKRTSDPYEEVATHLSKDAADALSAQKIPGVNIYKEKWRFYPGGSLASRLIGFVGWSGDTRTGRYGIERSYNDVLSRGEDTFFVNFFAELWNSVSQSVLSTEHSEGDVITTIEPIVQQKLEESLKGALSKWHSDEVGGIIMDPKTGAIYAMATLPDFDPNTYQNTDDISRFGNPIAEHVFELGSVVKPLTLAAAIDAKVITPDTTYEDKGVLTINGKRIANFDSKARGIVSMQTVLDKSLNTGAVFAEQKLGNEKFRDYMYQFGINKKTGVDLPGEVTNLTRNLEHGQNVDYATASFGQGIAVTPISAIRTFAMLANGGYLVTPHVGKEIQYKDGGLKELEFGQGEKVLSSDTALTMTRMLVHVFDNGTAGGALKLPHYSIAAKTGTAQLVKPEGGYYEDHFLHTMFGYLPAYDPKFIVFLYNRYPKGATFSAETLGSTFRDTVDFLINYYDLPPDR